MATNLAPIGLSTYARLQHLQQTIAALKKNTLAKQSELFVFSDAPKPGDEDKVQAVRRYLRTVDGFKAIHIVERTVNNRVLNSRGGIEDLLNKYGRTIFLEEDVITAPGFLQFMNDALEFYKDNPRIGSISAFCPPFKIPDDYSKDIFVLTRVNPWGLGLWKRYYKLGTHIPKIEYFSVYNDKKRLKDLEYSVGREAMVHITMDFERKLDAGDMKLIFWQFYDKKLTIYPRKSLTRSVGQDGSGFHMGAVTKWDVSELWTKTNGFQFSQDIDVDRRIQKEHYYFYQISYIINIVNFLQKIGIYKYIRPIVRIIPWRPQL